MLIFIFISLLNESIIRVNKHRTSKRVGNVASGGRGRNGSGFDGEILRNETIWKTQV
jgi:hypothetical protein